MHIQLKFSVPSRVSFAVLSSTLAVALIACRDIKTTSMSKADALDGTTQDEILDMNDISILFPLGDVAGLADVLPRLSDKPNPSHFAKGLPAAPLDEEAFVYPWTKDQRDNQLSVISPNIPRIDDAMESFVLASIRIDPCSNALQIKDALDKCTAEMRIVWQKMEGPANAYSLADSNVHTIYRLSASELKEILRTLRQAHKTASLDSKGLALAPHPVIVKEGLESPYLKMAIALVHRYARASKLSEVANMAANTTVNWTFGHIAVENGQPVHFPIPALGEGDTVDAVNMGLELTTDEGTLFKPHGFSKMGNLVKEGLLAPKDLAPELARELTFFPIFQRTIETFAVENPKLFNSKSINCVTCHVTTKQKEGFDYIRALVGNKIWASKFARPSFDYPRSSRGARERTAEEGSFLSLDDFGIYRFQTSRWNLETPFERGDSSRLQMFSFISVDSASIASRVVNDTAESLNFIVDHGL